MNRLINPKNLVFALVGLLLMGCTTTSTTPGLVDVNRSQFFLISQAELVKAGSEAYQTVLQEAEADGTLNQDPELLARLNRILDDMIPHAAHFRPDAVNWDWEVNLINDEMINAWVMPGGKIMFYSGLIEQLSLNDDEIAAIMGHEMAHELREHARERISQAQIGSVGLSVVGQLTGVQGAALDLAGAVMNVGILLPFSRVHEVEADRIGIELAARSGYDPAAAIAIWERMAKLSQGGAPPEFLSTHPSYDSRIKDLTRYSARLQPIYQQALTERTN
ncbi:M48 family metallopeptidase [Thiomicrospira sp. ALE5]|uniref:M48 family metallopeptidase n=1 Tax=Thiomicrospira sp. ALE5 TaxID=748650 RepID=UPI0008E9DA8C|nr:M48 family metallopeptidase [Thiomicrospira sp. ALE5]SFR56587.1 Peptidase family M48 [Thiomicrospira sp. ALE5]